MLLDEVFSQGFEPTDPLMRVCLWPVLSGLLVEISGPRSVRALAPTQAGASGAPLALYWIEPVALTVTCVSIVRFRFACKCRSAQASLPVCSHGSRGHAF